MDTRIYEKGSRAGPLWVARVALMVGLGVAVGATAEPAGDGHVGRAGGVGRTGGVGQGRQGHTSTVAAAPDGPGARPGRRGTPGQAGAHRAAAGPTLHPVPGHHTVCPSASAAPAWSPKVAACTW